MGAFLSAFLCPSAVDVWHKEVGSLWPVGKHLKLPARQRGDAPADIEETTPESAGEIEGLLWTQLHRLKRMGAALDLAIERGDATPALLREGHGVARALVLLSAELRQRERHDQRMVKAMSDDELHELVFEYAKQVDRQARQKFRALLDELDQQELVLGA